MLIIYHNADMDGLCSAAILHKKFPEARLLGYDYNQPFDVEANIRAGEDVVMADVSMSMTVMEAIANRAGKFMWIDHHVSAHNDFKAYFSDWEDCMFGSFSAIDKPLSCLYNNNISACESCWNYAFLGQPMPEPVKLLGMYDTWRGNGTSEWDDVILPFQYGMRVEGFTPETLSNWIFNDYANNPTRAREMVGAGLTVLKYQKQQDARLMQKSFDAVCTRKFGSKEIRCLVCNGAYSSTAFESKWDESKYDMMVGISFNGKVWSLSLRTTKDDVDCSVIAKQFGGGGHVKSSGCAVEDLTDFLIF